jgi:hypothetical protein
MLTWAFQGKPEKRELQVSFVAQLRSQYSNRAYKTCQRR